MEGQLADKCRRASFSRMKLSCFFFRHDARRLFNEQLPASVFSQREAVASFTCMTLAGLIRSWNDVLISRDAAG